MLNKKILIFFNTFYLQFEPSPERPFYTLTVDSTGSLEKYTETEELTYYIGTYNGATIKMGLDNNRNIVDIHYYHNLYS